MTFFFRRRRNSANRTIIDRLNEGIVAAVRQPAFFVAGGVPDTFNGRFELLVLHSALVVRRLRMFVEPGPQMAQDLVDVIFENLDPTLRELGVGDLAVPKRMKRLAEAFLGRAVAYDAALVSADAGPIEAALSRNIHGGERRAHSLAAYVRAAADGLSASTLDDLLAGSARFPEAAAFLGKEEP